jgi:hypothetical protein
MAIAPVLGMGTTYNLPNFHGEIMRITPEDTPFLSAIGGLTGGIKSNGQTEFEWQAADLRKGQKRVRLEGADAPTAQERPRINFSNVLEIHQEAVTLSYTKLAATQQYAGLAIGGPSNPVTDELSEQLTGTFKSIALDLEYDFLCGTYQKPSDNTTARQTRGLLAAIEAGVNGEDNSVDVSVLTETALTATGSTDVINSTATAFANGDQVVVYGAEAAGILNTQVYYVVNKATNTFKLATTSGGTAVDLEADVAGGITVKKTAASDVTKAQVLNLCQLIWKNGGIKEQATATVMVNASQHRVLTDLFISATRVETSRNVGGVALTTFVTEFGRLNLMLSRTLPEDAIVVCSLEQCAPVFLEIPGKGYMFVEELARTGASVKKQIYGEVGLKYGNALAHGMIRGAKVSHVV